MVQTSERRILIPVDTLQLAATVRVPVFADTLVIIAFTSLKECVEEHLEQLSRQLNDDGSATVLVSLLSEPASASQPRVGDFDVHLLTQHLIAITTAIHRHPDLRRMPIGYFAHGCVGAAAIRAAHVLGHFVSVIVCHDPELDAQVSELITPGIPTLFIVSSAETSDTVLFQGSHSSHAHIVHLSPSTQNSQVSAGTANSMSQLPDSEVNECVELSTQWFRRHFPRHPVVSSLRMRNELS